MGSAERRRLAILVASYAGLILVAFVAWITVHVYVGALSVIPMLFIAYYSRPVTALATAFAAGIVIALVNANVIPGGNYVEVPPAIDLITLSAALCVIVLVAQRLRATRRAAERDVLTGIVNRAYFMRALAEAAREATSAHSAGVLFCDLDGFKRVNDTYGHLTGDAVLRMAAARLVNAVRTVDVVARLGGDEFGVLVRGLHGIDEAEHLAAKIEHAFTDPFHAEHHRHTIGITIGISMCPADGTDAETVLRIADARMYRAKENKRVSRAVT